MNTFNSPLEAFLHWEKQEPTRIFLKQPFDGNIINYTYESAGAEIRSIASAIKDFNLSERSHIALLSKNCAHWILSDLAIMMSGHVSIPIYPTLNAKSVSQLLTHSESKAIIIGKLDDFSSQKKGIPDIHKICIGMYGENEGTLWEDIVKNQNPIEELPLINPDDLHTIIYTSGTTGTPKGVMHTVGNFMTSITCLTRELGIPNGGRFFSYLPLAHIAERLLCSGALVLGTEITFPESLQTFASDLENTQPNYFFAVPRIYSKFQDKILEHISQKKLTLLLKIPIINTIIKNKLKHKLGLKHAVFIASAAAPIAASLIRWFETIGITIQQGFGMTEDCCISHFNMPGASKIGTVGKKLSNVSVKLSPEGEICIKNTCLMKGYFKAPEITASVFDEEGFLKTGDKGEYDHDGFLTITGRVKDQFKTDKGKYISPAIIELQLSKNTDIEQICIVGTGIPQPIALVTPSVTGKMKSREQFNQSLIQSLNDINPQLEKHEKIERIVVMKEDWNVANGLTTPTLKVKRNSIEKIHQPYYKKWFEDEDLVIYE
jgi:long-chain acyl-CoA synthetase